MLTVIRPSLPKKRPPDGGLERYELIVPAGCYFFAGFAGAGAGFIGAGAGAGAGGAGGGVTAGAGAGFGGSGFFSQPIRTNAVTISNESNSVKSFFKVVTSFRGIFVMNNRIRSSGSTPTGDTT